MRFLSYTKKTLAEAVGAAFGGIDIQEHGISRLIGTVAERLFADDLRMKAIHVARIRKAARDMFSGDRPVYAPEHIAKADEAAFCEKRIARARTMLDTSALIGERLFDGLNAEGGLKILSRDKARTRIAPDGDVEFVIRFVDADHANGLHFIALIDPDTLQPVAATCGTSPHQPHHEDVSFGYISPSVDREIADHTFSSLDPAYLQSLRAAVESAPIRPRAMSEIERALLVADISLNNMVFAEGTHVVGRGTPDITDIHGYISISEDIVCEMYGHRVPVRYLVTLEKNPLRLDTVFAEMFDDGELEHVAYFDLDARRATLVAAGMDFDEDVEAELDAEREDVRQTMRESRERHLSGGPD